MNTSLPTDLYIRKAEILYHCDVCIFLSVTPAEKAEVSQLKSWIAALPDIEMPQGKSSHAFEELYERYREINNLIKF